MTRTLAGLLALAAIAVAGCGAEPPDIAVPAPPAGGHSLTVDELLDLVTGRAPATPRPPSPTSVADLLLPPAVR